MPRSTLRRRPTARADRVPGRAPITSASIYSTSLLELIGQITSEITSEGPADSVDQFEVEDYDEREDPRFDIDRIQNPIRKQRAHLLFFYDNGKVRALVRGLGRGRNKYGQRAISLKAVALKIIGQEILNRDPTFAHALNDGEGFLVQNQIAEALTGSISLKSAVERVSRVVNSEIVELPTGRTIPLTALFRKGAGPKGTPEERARVLALSSNLDLDGAKIAKKYLESAGEEPGNEKLEQSTTRAINRLRTTLSKLIISSSEKSAAEIARTYCSSRGLTPDPQLLAAITKIVNHYREI